MKDWVSAIMNLLRKAMQAKKRDDATTKWAAEESRHRREALEAVERAEAAKKKLGGGS